MKFYIIKDIFIDLLKKISNLTFNDINNTNEKKILIKIKNNKLYIIGNDNYIEIKIKLILDINNEIYENILLISYKKIFNIFKSMKKGSLVNVEIKEKFLYLENDGYKFSLCLYEKFNIPNFVLNDKIIEMCISSKNFLILTKNIYFSIANNNIKQSLNGMYFEIKNNKIKTISTDGYRLSTSKIIINNNIKKKINFILYKKTIIELIKILDYNEIININIILYKNFILFKFKNFTFTSILLNEIYPNCDLVINNLYKYKILINKSDLLKVFKTVSSILDENNFLVILDIKINNLIIYTKNSNNEYSKKNLYINYKGEEFKIGLNINFIIDILNNIERDDIIINFSDNISGLKIYEKDSYNKKYILMPIKI